VVAEQPRHRLHRPTAGRLPEDERDDQVADRPAATDGASRRQGAARRGDAAVGREQKVEALTGELAAGGALAMLALRTGRLLLSPALGGGRSVARPVVAAPRPELTLTHVGRLDAYTDLPWAAPAEGRRNISVPTTSGPEAITVSFTKLAGVLYINASFHRSTFEEAAVERAMRLVHDDPVRLVWS
jgi:hypothetical protein